MKAWCPNCREPRTVPFQPDPDERCDQCGFKLTRPPRKRQRGPRSTGPKRDWTAARAKVTGEEVCRLGRAGGDCQGQLEAAHTIGRSCDRPWTPPDGFDPTVDDTYDLWVNPQAIVPLCRRHHKLYDAHGIDLLPVLTIDEQLRAVLDADGLENARVRLCPLSYRQPTGEEEAEPDSGVAAEPENDLSKAGVS